MGKVPWQLWALLLLTVPVGIGWYAFSQLSLLDFSGCQSVDESGDASESTRLYCAQIAADRETSADLAKAIRLANSLSTDHPLRREGDRLIKRWSDQLLSMGETTFQAGMLDEAIAMVQAIPSSTPTFLTAEDRIRSWRDTWAKAEEIYTEVEQSLEADAGNAVFQEARRLLAIDNQYWQTTRYQELMELIQASKAAKNQQIARDRQKPATTKLVTNDAFSAEQVMEQWRKEQEQEAIAQLAKVKKLAQSNRIDDLKAAVAAAEEILYGTPQYEQAQQLIDRWNQEIELQEDRPYLNQAVELASKGDLNSLQAAIDQAQKIYYGRTLYNEAQTKIDQWYAQVRQLQSQSDPISGASLGNSTNYPIPQPVNNQQ
ncbi:hypothetical protein [Pantanalinema sp. GBBB05]|uniref:hypothetical protein n=1 Tax=Pantanalinema sp. GBBB05 TaxID=2604139 RepID=UPI001E146F04|nr:hypothetical protein [Pantanalinema sp. GBBB05]